MHTYFGVNFIGVGEDHKGKHAFNFKNNNHTNNLYNLVSKSRSQIDCWFEGPNASKKSPSFKNFVREFKQWLTLYDEFKRVRVNEIGWELTLKFNRDEELTGVLLGAEAYEYEKLISSQLNSKQTLAEAFVNAGTIRGSQSSPVRMHELVRNLSDQNGPTDVLLKMQEPNSANRKTLDAIYAGGYGAMRAKYFAGTQNAATSSYVFKRVDNFNKARDKHLAKLMKTKGGIFLAGDGHIETIKNFL